MADNIIGETLKKNSQFLKWAGIIFLVIVAFWAIKKYMAKTETLYDVDFSPVTSGESVFQQPEPEQEHQIVEPILGQDMSNTKPEFLGTDITFPTGGQDILPLDLLPKSQVAGEFDESMSPTTDLSARNYLVTSNNFGLDTQTGTNKNANRQLRNDPFIPVNQNVSPWNVSSLTPNLYQKEFNIGQ